MNLAKSMLAAVAMAIPMSLSAETAKDPYLWLEDVDGERALEWVRSQNAISQKTLESAPGFSEIYERLLSIYDSDQRIPAISLRGKWLYNFWKDAEHPRGLWRRTSKDEYAKAEPAWEVILDLDALAANENENWVWKGESCLFPAYQRCLIRLSRGGADAHVVREFDVDKKAFVADGFSLTEAKHSVAWQNRDSILVATDTGPGSLTASGYPRMVRQWARNTPLSDAKLVFEAQESDVGVDVAVYNTASQQREIYRRAISFFDFEYFVRAGDYLALLPVPGDANLDLFRDQLILQIRRDWHITGNTYSAGSLIAIPLVSFIEGNRKFEVLFEPSEGVSLDSVSATRNGLLLNLLDQVRGRIAVLRHTQTGWKRSTVKVPKFGEARARALNSEQTDAYLLTVENFLNPTYMLLGVAGKPQHRRLKRLPHFFDADGLEIQQHFAVSKDGTRIPYFQVSRKDMKADGSTPTLLYGYGGFEISLTPGYNPAVGAAWLERGGSFVLANIRGGGEYGPPWHLSAIREHRQRAYDDFAAVARDLIERGVTSAKHLGIQGGSNGGLLVGVQLTQNPELFGAVVCQVPLLDMRRYNKLLAGASWVSEYGNPDDPEQWAWISKYSPYQNAAPEPAYPPTLLMTSTRDDRVHPGHARKMTARLHEFGQPALYFENIEGGHGGSANNRQKAYQGAMAYSFLWEQLK
tara:strand:- start:11037 stop:13118 length:2082 start_codon:yes stop_codon:yes gene_type:complete